MRLFQAPLTRSSLAPWLLALLTIPAGAQAQRPANLVWLDEHYDQTARTARTIWEYAEVGYQETQSRALLQQQLADAGFTVEAGVADIPTAFVASYGSGEPVLAILATPAVTTSSVPAPQRPRWP